jgi:hypothetical protein
MSLLDGLRTARSPAQLTKICFVCVCNKQDATDAFTAFHFSSEKAKKMLDALPTVKDGSIAASIKEDGASPLVADFRVLVEQWKDRGCVVSSACSQPICLPPSLPP